MSNVRSLTDLFNAYRDERGAHGRPLSFRAAATTAGQPGMYETFRRIGNGEHSGRINEETIEALVRLGLNEREVRKAAGQQLTEPLPPFELPARANRLSLSQRQVVLAVIDAILSADADPEPMTLAEQLEHAKSLNEAVETIADRERRSSGNRHT